MKIRFLDRIFMLALIIGIVVIIATAISDLIVNIKVAQQNNCITLNKKYYCEVK